MTSARKFVRHLLPRDYAQLAELDRASVCLLAERLDDSWHLASLTELMYSIPKVVRGLPADCCANR